MDFEKNVPKWDATGIEPPESLKTSGFTAGFKPPAAFFNWFWSSVSACLTEIRAKLKGHAESTSNPHGVTAAQVGLGNVDNTADSEKHVSYASTAGTANQTKNDLTIRFNGGQTESSDKWTYNGSTSRSVNITPENIGAAKKDLSNVDPDDLKSAASAAGIGGDMPIVEATSTDGVAYTATVPDVAELTNGMLITIVPSMTSTSTAITLNVNGLGAKNVRLPLSFNNAAMAYPKMDSYYVASRPITLMYDTGYSAEGIWKVYGKQKTSAQDLYGTVPIESGGTSATSAAEACANINALPASGGSITGFVEVASANYAGMRWYCANGSKFDLRAIGPDNVFQLTLTPSGGSEIGVINVDTDGVVTLSGALPINSGGTGATSASDALANLGVKYSASQPDYIDGGIWLKPV